jgi:hypothetical protein
MTGFLGQPILWPCLKQVYKYSHISQNAKLAPKLSPTPVMIFRLKYSFEYLPLSALVLPVMKIEKNSTQSITTLFSGKFWMLIDTLKGLTLAWTRIKR